MFAKILKWVGIAKLVALIRRRRGGDPPDQGKSYYT